MDRQLHHAIRKVVQEEIERALPVELWLVNEFDGDVVVPVERIAKEIAQSVVNRLDVGVEIVTVIDTGTPSRPRKWRSRP
jgi:hypothetical protein